MKQSDATHGGGNRNGGSFSKPVSNGDGRGGDRGRSRGGSGHRSVSHGGDRGGNRGGSRSGGGYRSASGGDRGGSGHRSVSHGGDRGGGYGGRSVGKKPGFKAGVKGSTEENILLPTLEDGGIRLLVFGGVSEIGKNLYAVEYKNDIVIFECGVLFGESSLPGVRGIISNLEYLKKYKKNIRGMVVTDASASHIGGIPFVAKALGSPAIYARELTANVIQKQMRLHRHAPQVTYHSVEKKESVALSENVTLTFFNVSDKTPTSFGVLLETPSGCVAYTGNLRVENKKGEVYEKESSHYDFLKEKKIVLSLGQSVNAERNGFALTNKEIVNSVLTSIRESCDGRAILPLFPSQITRNSRLLNEIIKTGRKVFVQGSVMMDNLFAAIDAGVLEVPKEYLMPIEEIVDDDTPHETVVIVSADEDETNEVMESVSFNKHKYISVDERDTVLFPRPIISTRSALMQDLQNRLSRIGATIIAYETDDVKALSYASKDELLWLHQHIPSRFFVPIAGFHYMLSAHAHIAQESGIDLNNVVMPERGMAIDISPDGSSVKKFRNKLPKRIDSIDGKMVSAVHDIVLRDRVVLSQEGIFIVIVLMDLRRLTVKKSPDIISRGFIYLKESQDLISRTRLLVKNVAEKEANSAGRIEIDALKKVILKAMQGLLMDETGKRPLVVPVIFTSQ